MENHSLHSPADGMNTLRAFIAIEMPRTVLDIIRQSQETLRNGGIRLRWVRPESVHLTLQFLGDISTTAVPDIQEAMERSISDLYPFSIKIKGVGIFPGFRRPRVIWLGLNGRVDQLENLQQHLSGHLAGQGFPVEKRPFKGHLTIGRAKGAIDADRLKTVISKLNDIETEPFEVDTICLFKSDLKPTGAEYTPMATARIGK